MEIAILLFLSIVQILLFLNLLRISKILTRGNKMLYKSLVYILTMFFVCLLSTIFSMLN